MNKITLLLLFLCTLTISAQEETYNSDSFKVTLGDLQTHTFTKDSSANAIVIYEQGNSYVHKEKYDLRTEVKRKIKILNKEGVKRANISIYLYKSKDNKETMFSLC